MDWEWFFYGVDFLGASSFFLFMPVHSITISHEIKQQKTTRNKKATTATQNRRKKIDSCWRFHRICVGVCKFLRRSDI